MAELRTTVLVVDDDPVLRALVNRGLVRAGFEVLEAGDGLHAVRILQATDHPPVQLVVTDIRMPVITGDDLGRLLHYAYPELPVLYMSGFSAPDLEFLSPEERQRCWLEKPFAIEALVRSVRSLLSRERGKVPS